MKKVTFLAVLVVFGMTASPAFGQATRTWVSGVGDDANPCSRTAPCKTFAGAISKTAVDGIIQAMDDGGFGALTITKSITVDGAGHAAGMLASGGINAVNINLAESATDPARRVVLRNLNIEGNGTTLGLNGLNIFGDQPASSRVAPKSVTLENVHIGDFSRNALTLTAGFAAAAPVNLTLDNVFANENGGGLNLQPGSSSSQVNALVRGSRILEAHQNGQPDSGFGVTANGGAHVWLTGDTIWGNDVGLRTLATNGGTGVIDSFCDNQIGGNADNGSPPNELCPEPPTQTQIITNTVGIKQCVVPKLKGLPTSFAKKLLSAANCRLGKVTKKVTRKRSRIGKVLSQKTRAGTTLSAGTPVAVTVGKKKKTRR
jgi:hypothetical protein